MRRFQFQVVLVLGAALLVVSGSVFPASDGVTYDTRALTGDAAPGTDAVFSGFGYPMLNGAGPDRVQGHPHGQGRERLE